LFRRFFFIVVNFNLINNSIYTIKSNKKNRYICLLQLNNMGYKIKIQRVERGNTKSFYVNFPAAVAEAGDITKGEEMEWCIQDKDTYILKRVNKSKLPGGAKDKE
jgi:hypothetical protein